MCIFTCSVQVYAGGELLGGCDVVTELAAEGQLNCSIDVALQVVSRLLLPFS
jgi:glutaredoxin-related protein